MRVRAAAERTNLMRAAPRSLVIINLCVTSISQTPSHTLAAPLWTTTSWKTADLTQQFTEKNQVN